jgi:hypothetical protein
MRIAAAANTAICTLLPNARRSRRSFFVFVRRLLLQQATIGQAKKTINCLRKALSSTRFRAECQVISLGSCPDSSGVEAKSHFTDFESVRRTSEEIATWATNLDHILRNDPVVARFNRQCDCMA